MTKNTTRRYIYDENYYEVMLWGSKNFIRGQNNKVNFPFTLKKYLEYLKENKKDGL